MKRIFKELRKREKDAYPSFMLGLQHARTWSDLQDYCNHDQVHFELLGTKGYILMCPVGVLDMVASPSDIWKAITVIKAYYGNRPFVADFRETTSWRLVRLAERRGKLRVSNVSQWYWESEVMYEASVQVIL